MQNKKHVQQLWQSWRGLTLGSLFTLSASLLLAAQVGLASRGSTPSSTSSNSALVSQVTATVLAFGLPLVDPIGIVSSPDEATLYITDQGSQGVFRLPTSGGTPVLIATGEPFTKTAAITISPDGSTLFIAGWHTGQILSLPVTGGTPTALALGVERLPNPSGIAISPNGSTLYIADQSGAIFSLPVGGGVLTVLHSGPPLGIGIAAPGGLAISHDGSTLYVSSGINGAFRLPVTGGALIRLDSGPPLTNISALTLSADGNTLYLRNETTDIYSLSINGGTPTLIYSGFPLFGGGFIQASRDGGKLYLADYGYTGSSVADRVISINLACTGVSITSQPGGQTVCASAPANFSVTAGGTGPFTYQWRKNGVAISGATSSNLNIASVTASDAGTYDVVVSGTCGGAVTSAPAVLTVNSLTLTAPSAISASTGPDATTCGVVVNDAALGAATTSYTCESVTISRNGVPANNLFPVGTTTITYTANTASGRTATATQIITIIDNTSPTASCPAGTSAEADACGRAIVPNVASSILATDNCGPLVITQSPVAGSLVGLGTTTLNITVTDPSNNSTSCTTTFTVTGSSGPVLTALGPAQIWVGLKNSDDVGTKFDLLAEVLKNGAVIGSGQLNDVPGGSSGFNNAVLSTINQALPGPVNIATGDTLSLRLSVRVAISSSHVSGTARLWYDDSAANSRFSAAIGGVINEHFLRGNFALNSAAGVGPKKTIDVMVSRNVGGNPFKPFGTWSKAY